MTLRPSSTLESTVSLRACVFPGGDGTCHFQVMKSRRPPEVRRVKLGAVLWGGEIGRI